MNETDSLSEYAASVAGLVSSVEGVEADVAAVWSYFSAIVAFAGATGCAFWKAGCVRSTSVICSLHFVMLDVSVAAFAWWLCGYAFAFSDNNAFIGSDLDLLFMGTFERSSVSLCSFLQSAVLAIVTVGIASGCVVERLNIKGYILFVFFIAAFIFPVAAHWVWGRNGWLSPFRSDMALYDASGCVTVCVLGGSVALAAGRNLGCRVTESGHSVFTAIGASPLQPHNRLYQGTGLLLIWFSWLGVSTSGVGVPFADSSHRSSMIAHAAFTTLFLTGTSAVTAVFISLQLLGYSHFQFALLGIYSGLVVSCGTCFYVPSAFLPLIGSLGACFSLLSLYVIRHMRQIDDPCLSIPIFLVPGCWGSLAVALFADEGYVSALHRGSPVVNDLHYGLLVGGGVQLLCRHVLAIMSIMLWAIGSSALFIRVMRRFPRYCVLTTAEANHLDKFQHGCYYTDYVRQFLEPDNELEPEPEPLPPVELSHPHSPASTSGFRNSFGARPSTVHDIPEYIAPNVVEGRLYKDFSADNDDSENDTSVDTNVLVLAHHQAKARTLKHEPSPFSTISLEHASRSRVALFFITLVIVTSASTVQDLPALVDGGTPALFAFCEDVAFEKLANTSMQFQGRVSALDGDLLSLWQLICGVIVFSMQLGFCFLEAGNVRSGSVLTIIFKNFADCALGGLCWWFIGYCLAYGESFGIWGFDANLFVFSPAPSSELFGAYPSFFLSYAYMAAACTIISGAVAERISFEAYYAMVISVCALSYPACVHWMWSSTGLLSPFSENKILANGVLDFSGSIVIHLFGGTSAVTLAYLTGPRALRGGVTVFSEEGRKIVEPHNKFQLATGTLLLWFGWFAFNGGSVRSMSQGSSGVAGNAVVTTLLSSGVSTVVGGIYSKVALGFWDISICCNSALVGLVSITAGCAYVAPPFAIVIGIVSVPCYVGFSKLTVYLGIDDVVGAGAVHAAGGAWGGLAVGLFADAGRIQAVLSDPEAGKSYGLLLGGGVGQVAVQMVGILSVAAWAILTMFILWLPLRFTIGLRVPVADEYLGLDIAKHKCHSYDYIGKLELERTRALEAVEVAQGIAVALVLFDTEKVIQILDDHQEAEAVSTFSREKEDPLLRAFRSLAENLEQYRPYLPDSLLDMANEHQAAMEDKPSDSVPPPGRGGSVTIVFTDIQNSTASWEACPEGMSKGLKLHNQVMRRCIAANCGYEVKTIGDAFMVAFDSIIDAVKFALDAHVDLYHAPWPKELLEVPYCAKDAEVLWAGPRVRIGVHCGEVNVEMNNVVGRCDYFGGTVNRAARVEGACVGGAVCVTSDVLEKIASIKKAQSNDFTCDNGLDLVDNPIVVHMGTVPLKGAGASTLSLLIPQTLAKRKGQVEQMLKTRLLSNQKRQSLSKRSSGIESVSMSMADGQSEFGDGHAKKRHHDFMKERFERIPVATTGRVEAEYDCTFDGNPEESVSMVNEALSRVLNCLDRTDGTVIALIGMSLACGWNTTKKTPLHLDNALRFVGMLYTAQARLNEGDTTSRRFYVGITTGTVLVGNVGTQSQRFVSVIGPSVKLSGCLAFTARDIDIFCLCATLIADDQPFQTIRRHMRPVDRWYFAGKAASVTVYEVRADSMKQLFVTDDTDDDDDWAWSDAYWEAYENADHVRMLSEAPQNPIVAAVAVRLREKLSLRPPLRF